MVKEASAGKNRAGNSAVRRRAAQSREQADAAEATASPAGDPLEIRDIDILGEPEGLQLIPHTMTSLVMLVGKYEDGDRVLTPHVEIRLATNPEDDGDGPPVTVFKSVITLENATFILADFAGDLANVAKYLKAMASKELPLDTARMSFILRNLNWARREVEIFKSAVRDILSEKNVTEDLEWPPSG